MATRQPPWDKATEPPPRFQWEPSSGSFSCSQSVNCGPTGAAQQADYYNDRPPGDLFPIERTRTRVGVAACRPTTAWEQAEMLRRRGVPCDVVEISSMDQLDLLVGHGRRPVGIGVEMSRVSARTRGHSFLGWHRITLLRVQRRRNKDGRLIRGYIYTDPNFGPHRPDPKKGRRWISRRALRYAFLENSPRYAIVPHARKGAA